MICDGDNNSNALLSDDSLEHEGEGSNDKEIANDMFVNCWVRLPKHKGNQTTWIGNVEPVSVDLEHSNTNTVIGIVTVVISKGGENCLLWCETGEEGER